MCPLDQENDIKRTFDVFKKHSLVLIFLRFYIVPHVFEHAESENDCNFDQTFREPFAIRHTQNNLNIPVHFYTKSLN